jgi:hypothetical protein
MYPQDLQPQQHLAMQAPMGYGQPLQQAPMAYMQMAMPGGQPMFGVPGQPPMPVPPLPVPPPMPPPVAVVAGGGAQVVPMVMAHPGVLVASLGRLHGDGSTMPGGGTMQIPGCLPPMGRLADHLGGSHTESQPPPAAAAVAKEKEMKALTAYQAFFRVTFDQLKAKAKASSAQGKCPTTEIVSEIGKRWRDLDDAGKAAYAGSAQVVAVRCKPKREKAARKGAGEKKTGKKKRSLTAYQLFFRDESAVLSGKAPGSVRREGITQMEIVKTVGERWRSIDEAVKADYQAKALEEQQRFAREQPEDEEEEVEEDAAPIPLKKARKSKKQQKQQKQHTRKKRSLTAYQLFFRDESAVLSGKAPGSVRREGITQMEIVKTVGERWRSIDEAVKADYQAKAQEEARRFEREQPALDALAEQEEREREEPAAKKRKKKKKSKDGPQRKKRSLTAYQLFFRDESAVLSGKAPGSVRRDGITQNEIVKTVGERWRAIDPVVKADYQAKAAEEAIKFEAENGATAENPPAVEHLGLPPPLGGAGMGGAGMGGADIGGAGLGGAGLGGVGLGGAGIGGAGMGGAGMLDGGQGGLMTAAGMTLGGQPQLGHFAAGSIPPMQHLPTMQMHLPPAGPYGAVPPLSMPENSSTQHLRL